jgi:hypothetical protein
MWGEKDIINKRTFYTTFLCPQMTADDSSHLREDKENLETKGHLVGERKRKVKH